MEEWWENRIRLWICPSFGQRCFECSLALQFSKTPQGNINLCSTTWHSLEWPPQLLAPCHSSLHPSTVWPFSRASSASAQGWGVITCKEGMESHGGNAGLSKLCTLWPFMFYCFASRDCLKVAVSQFLATVENNNIKQGKWFLHLPWRSHGMM